MPFDGIDAFDNHPIAKLGAVERMLATEQQWCKGRLRDAHGRHCLVGAIEAVGGRQVLQRPILQSAREVSGKRLASIGPLDQCFALPPHRRPRIDHGGLYIEQPTLVHRKLLFCAKDLRVQDA